jgi:signal-transduction protein with cAMP-binding, CBS, and nucleotidyltransferase domain
MKDVDLKAQTKESIQRFVYGITFFKEVIDAEPEQFEKLMECSRIVEADPSEFVIHKGDKDPYLYFLLKGRLVVLPNDDSDMEESLNEINPGELFGAMAMVTGQERSATIRVHQTSKANLLFAVDFNHFKDIHDFSEFSMNTKISFYRLVVHNIRWTLETNKMREPNHPLIAKMRQLTLFRGERGTMEELESLYQQANELASILSEWNTFGK